MANQLALSLPVVRTAFYFDAGPSVFSPFRQKPLVSKSQPLAVFILTAWFFELLVSNWSVK